MSNVLNPPTEEELRRLLDDRPDRLMQGIANWFKAENINRGDANEAQAEEALIELLTATAEAWMADGTSPDPTSPTGRVLHAVAALSRSLTLAVLDD